MKSNEVGLLITSINGIIIPISILVQVARNKKIGSLYRQLSYCGAASMFGLGIVSTVLLIIMRKSSIIARKSQNEKLLDAAESGKIAKIKSALAKGANIHYRNYLNHNTALHIAARKGNLEAVRYLIDKGADINAQSISGNTSLSYAIENEHVEMIKYLLRKGANVDSMPFHAAREFQRIREMTHLGKIVREYKKGNLKVILDYTDDNNQHKNNNIKQLVLEFKEIKRRCNSDIGLSFVPRYLL